MKAVEILGNDGVWYCPIGGLCAWTALFWKESLEEYPEFALIRDLMLSGV